MDVMGPNPNNGNHPQLEERLLLLETEVKFWRLKFEELEKWRVSLDEWIHLTFGYSVRTNSHNSCNSAFVSGSKGAGNVSDSHFSSPRNGWSPDSPDPVARTNSTVCKNEGSKHDVEYTDGDEDEKYFGANQGSVPKRKRGRPKKNSVNNSMNNISAGLNPNMMQDTSQDANDIVPWENSPNIGAGAQIKRGRGRPRKIRINSEEMMPEGGDQINKISGRKKPGTPTIKTCDICLIECESNQDLIAHKRAVHPERLFTCNICHETYLHPGFLARHMETHTLDRNFKCTMCISSFNTYQLLKLHCGEKHGIDIGRQTEWKHGGDQNGHQCRSLDSSDFGMSLTDRYNGQQSNTVSSSPHTMISPQSNCTNGTDYGVVNSNHMSMSPMSHHQHHNAMQHLHPHPGMVHQQQHMPQHPISSPMALHHANQMNHHHQTLPQASHDSMNHHQLHQHHSLPEDEDDDVDSDGFPLDFGNTGAESLPTMFDAGNNDMNGMNSYLSHVEADALHMF